LGERRWTIHFWKNEQRCRKLADSADQFTNIQVLDLAANYDDKLSGKPSRATRLMILPTPSVHSDTYQTEDDEASLIE
jgi:hypothetical protein